MSRQKSKIYKIKKEKFFKTLNLDKKTNMFYFFS